MLLEIRTVSRKTPGDGRFEISEESARRLRAIATPLRVRVDDDAARGEVVSQRCTCAKGASAVGGDGHEHHFLASDALKRLTPDETVVLELLDDGELAVARPHPLRPGE